VFTTAATATIIFLVGDITNLVSYSCREATACGRAHLFVVGATGGGLLLVHPHIYAPVLPFVITVAAVATAEIVFRAPMFGS
jgi:hypothetical protein